jgi:protein-L-isoaspartate(D-aspartate) O-methyltransferase
MRKIEREMRESPTEIQRGNALGLLQFAVTSRAFNMDFEQARFNMIEQQIRTWEVLDPQVLDLLFEVKREDFVPAEHRALAFADLEVPLGHGESMMQPKVEARIVQELAIQPHETVYEVGTGSGYLTALLAHRARQVTSAEIHPDLAARARAALKVAGIDNVTLLEGDSAAAPLAETPFDVIVVTGSMPILPQSFLDRLAPGGRLFAVLGDLPVMKALIVRQPVPGSFQHTELFETLVKPLVNAAQPSRFRF